MVAIVSGSSLGLFDTSLRTLGSASEVGQGTPGRSGERIIVNSANGNLVIQDQDDRLAAVGPDAEIVRTYNSKGVFDGDNNDNWRIGVYEGLKNLTGSRNSTGSTLTKTFGDGTEVIYTYNATLAKYVSSAGDGANDTITWNPASNPNQWLWVDGSGRNTEVYDWTGTGSSAVGKILKSADSDGNATNYAYRRVTTPSGAQVDLLVSVTDPSGQVTTLTYDAAAARNTNLQSIRVTSSGQNQTLTQYFYDSANRLRQVVVDLTPANAVDTVLLDSNADGLYEGINNQAYVTTYTYQTASSRLVASITQTDGTCVEFTYDGSNRVTQVTERLSSARGTQPLDPLDRRTTFNYLSSTVTQVTDQLGRMTAYTRDASGRLTRIVSPAVGGINLQTDYTYDASGNVTSITENLGATSANRVTTLQYDANGNLTYSRDSAGNVTARTYSATNQLLTETRFVGRDLDNGGTQLQATQPLTTRYVYDAEEHLRFVVSADGRVTEHRYNANGTRALTLRYGAGTYNVAGFAATTLTQSVVDGPITVTASTFSGDADANLQSFISAQDKTKLERLDYAYDVLRAQVSTVTAWGATDATGTGVAGTASVTRFVYDQRGQLLQTIEARGEATSAPNDYLTSFTYDGLGRVLTTSEWIAGSGSTTIARTATTQYDDIGNRTLTSLVNGLVTTSSFNKAGELIGVTTSGPGIAAGTTSYAYDADNRLLMVTDPTNVRVFNVYDEAGRRTGEVDGDGSLTEYVYNRASELIEVIRYATPLTTAQMGLLVNSANRPLNPLVSAIRPTGTNPSDQLARNVYNNAGQLQYTLLQAAYNATTQTADYNVSETVYDGAGQVTDTIAYATVLTIPRAIVELRPTANPRQMADAANASNIYTITPSATGDDRRTRYFYGNDGQLLGTLDAAGYLSEATYDAAGLGIPDERDR